MTSEDAFLTALGFSLLLSFLVLQYLRSPLHRILCDLCGREERARFWVAYSNIMLVLVPLAAVMIGRTSEHSNQPPVILVTDQLKWAILGLILAVFFIALGVATFILPASTPVSLNPTQVDDLQRLISKVDEIRAHEIVSRTSSSGAKPA